jgi:tetratricopeptide (TPR) repeat protein
MKFIVILSPFICLLIFILSCTSETRGQYIIIDTKSSSLSFLEFDADTIKPLDKTFKLADSLTIAFHDINREKILAFRRQVRDLNFDHCTHCFEILLYVNGEGIVQRRQLTNGCGLPKIDSVVMAKIDSALDKLKPLTYEGKAIKARIPLRLKFYNKTREDDIDRALTWRKLSKFNFSGDYDKRLEQPEECENDEYFYNEGVKNYQSGDISGATHNFKKAVEYNGKDYDALYNLGLCYQQKNKLKDACQCFKEAGAAGDTSALKAISVHCTGLQK